MRYLTLVPILLAAACTSGPGGPSTQQTGKDEYSIRYGESITVQGSILEIGFQAVLADSRCPSDVTCIWQGEGKVQLGLTIGDGPTIPVELNTNGPQTVTHGAFTITLVGLDPYPVTTSPHETGDYLVHLRVSAGVPQPS